MEVLTYPVIAIALFVIAFIFNKRFGLLGMALAAGALISVSWQNNTSSVLGALGLSLYPQTITAISAVIILLPAGLLLFHGYSYKTILGRVIGASLFTVLAMTFLIDPLSRILTISNPGSEVLSIVSSNHDIIIGFCLIIAVIDTFLFKSRNYNAKHRKS